MGTSGIQNAILARHPHRVITQKERAPLDFLRENIPSLVNPGAAMSRDERAL